MSFFMRSAILVIMLFSGTCYASTCGDCINDYMSEKCDRCCGKNGGVSYCDSSAGRIVCKNGFYSTCYCDRHAVMDLTHIQGCCLWQGGVLNFDNDTGFVICNNGGVSEICSDRSYILEGIARF